MKYIKSENIKSQEDLLNILNSLKAWENNKDLGERPFLDIPSYRIYKAGEPWQIEWIDAVFITYKLTTDENEVIKKTDTGGNIETETIIKGSDQWPGFENWKEAGNEPEPLETTAEKKQRLEFEFMNEFELKMLKADKWELPSIQKRYGIEQANVEEYKSSMCQILGTHTTIAKLEHPEWPAVPENAQ